MITPGYSPTATERVLPRMALDFTTASLDARVTVTRALNTATRVNSNGFIEVVNANLPRFDFDPITLVCKGLLIEESRPNLLAQSSGFNTGSWTVANATITGSATTSPDGTNNASKLAENTTSSTDHPLYTPGATTVTAGAAYTVSFYLKQSERTWAAVGIFDGGWLRAYFNLATGVVGTVAAGTTATITPAGSGFYRCTITRTMATTSAYAGVWTANADNSFSYAGTVGSGIFVWGAQLEAGAFATSYIPTTTTSLTRNADDVSMTGTNFTSWYNQSAGTLVARFAPAVANFGANRYPVAISAGASTNAFAIRMSSGAFLGYCLTAGVNQYFNSAGTASAGVYAICGLSLDSTGGVFSANATLSTPVSSATLPTVDRLALGNFTGGAQGAYHIAQIWYYPQRLINRETQAFTK